MSISGLGQSYLALLNGAKTQQKTGASVTIMDSPQPVDPTQVTISAEARAAAAAVVVNSVQAAASVSSQSVEAQVGNATDNTPPLLSMGTDQGQKDIDVDAYFSPPSVSSSMGDLKSLPPLLLPSSHNIDALSKDASAKLKSLLATHHIPTAPTSISFDESGQIQLPDNYEYADQFKQALKESPSLGRELSTVNSLASQLVGMSSSAGFSTAISQPKTQAEADAISAKNAPFIYDTQSRYKISLGFDSTGNIQPLADNQPYLDIVQAGRNSRVNAISVAGVDPVISPEVQTRLNEIKSKPALERTQQDYDYLFANDKKLAQIEAKPLESRTAEDLDYEQKARGFVNTMAGLSSGEKALYDEAVSSGNVLAAEGLAQIALLRVGFQQAGGQDGSTYDPSKTEITPETIASFFSQSFVDPSHQPDQQLKALSDFLKLRSSA